ncbi:MAG: signal peptide peptidase SppA, partial [Candidatus Micrarchaeota archaeon]|nr:signal peptide peptidase SppA [Candidatus Micrarchaeota archaeon]
MDVLKLVVALVVLGVLSGALVVMLQSGLESGCVATLSVHGGISLDGANDLFSSEPSARSIVNQIHGWQDSASPVLFLDVNSPGGSAVASQEIFEALRESDKPTVAYLGEVAASGGYYVAAGTDKIVAHPDTITGSIGAVADVTNYADLLDKLGVRQFSIKSGELKDIGAPYRNMTDAEKTLLQELIDETAGNFRSDVETARDGKLTPAYNVTRDARILSAKQALSAGLVDEIGSRAVALKRAAELGNLSFDGRVPE